MLTIAGAFPKFAYEQVNAFFTVTDISLNYNPIKRLNIEAKASILRAYNRSIKDWLIGMPSDRFSLGLNYELPKSKFMNKTYVEIEIPIVLKQTRIPDETIHGKQDYKLPPNGYTVINLSAGTLINVSDKL